MAKDISPVKAIDEKDAKKVQQILDAHVLFVVNINPESRVKLARGPAEPTIQQAGWTPVLVKIERKHGEGNRSRSPGPQSGEVYSGRGENSRTTPRSWSGSP
ncbi:MAG: hypothetical protein U0792_07770 [Gemmataceae bacterium]